VSILQLARNALKVHADGASHGTALGVSHGTTPETANSHRSNETLGTDGTHGTGGANRDAPTVLSQLRADLEFQGGCSIAGQVEWWRARFQPSALPPGTDAATARLIAMIADVAQQDWLFDAARLGWNDVELFGVNARAASGRVEAWGLVTAIALSPHSRTNKHGVRQATRLASISADAATIATPTGATFHTARARYGLAASVPAWELIRFDFR
jgi:hypothetical protein